MDSQKQIILLDVQLENLYTIFLDTKWNVDTVTRKLGSTKEDRDDSKIFQFAKDIGCIVVTEDKGLVDRCRSSDVDVITIEPYEKATNDNKR